MATNWKVTAETKIVVLKRVPLVLMLFDSGHAHVASHLFLFTKKKVSHPANNGLVTVGEQMYHPRNDKLNKGESFSSNRPRSIQINLVPARIRVL